MISQVGVNGNGTSAASPFKFLILVTDGLQSDRSNNWSCTSWGSDPAWSYNPTCYGGYATSINASQCAQLKANGVILAVLETPYVPLTGQDPNVQPYEKTVRHVIYPAAPARRARSARRSRPAPRPATTSRPPARPRSPPASPP